MLYIFTPVFCVALCVGAVFSFSNNRVYGAATVKSNGAYLNLSGGANILNGFEGAQKETLYLGKYNNAPVKWRVLAKNDTKYGSGENNLLLFADSVLGTTVYNDTTYGGDYYGTSKLRALLNGGYYIKPNADCDVSAVTSYMTESSAYASTLFAGLNDDLVMTAKDIVTHDSHFTRSAWFEDPKVNPWMRTVGNDLYTSDASIITSKNILYLTTNIAGKSINTKTGKTADPNFSVNYSVANGIAETTKGDKLFPLDYDDIVNKTYGFVDASGKTYLDKLGSTYASNYASKGYKYGYPSIHEGEVKYAQFKPTGSGSYWLRMSAKVFDSWENGAFYVNANGEITASLYSVEGTGALAVQGVRPAFVLDATKLAYVTTATPTAGSGFVKLATTQTTPTYKIYVKDTNFSTFSSSAKGNVKEDNGNLSITYNNPTGETGGNLLVLLSPKSAEGGEVDYQAAVAMSSTASATKQAATTLKLPDNVSLSTHNLTVLYTSATSANATENIYCTYPADGGIDTPADFNAGKFNDASKWISDLQEGDRPSWWNSDIYGDTPYMSVDSVEYTPIKGNKTNVTTAAIKDAGSYKVTFKLASGLTWSDGSTSNKSFTISVAQAESSIVPQYANAPTYVPDELPAISQKAGGTPGTIKWDDGQHPQSGTKNYTWTFTPENENNYTTIKSSKEFTFAAREVESVTIKSFDTKGKTIYTNTSAATLKTYMTVEVKFVGIAEKVELDPGDYDLQINANNKLVKGSNKLKVKYTTSDNKTKYSAEYTISDVEELTYKTITNIVLGNDEFTYPVKASDILAEIISVDVEMNDGSSGELTADEILTLMELEGDLTVDTTSVTFKIKDTEAETDYPVTIKKGDHDLSKIKFEGNKNKIEYDENNHSIAYTGDLPEGVEAEYSYNGTKQSTPFEFTDAGTYTITLSFKNTDKNYNDLTSKSDLTADLVIDQAEVDMTGVTFKGAQQYADGTEYTLEIKGDLPEKPAGIQVTYSVEGQSGTTFKEKGKYKFTAKFTHTNKNYKDIDDMTAELEITDKSKYDMNGVSASGTGGGVKVSGDFENGFTASGKYDGGDIEIALGDLPAGVSVKSTTYEKMQSDGTYAPVNGLPSGAGDYRVTVSFDNSKDDHATPQDMEISLSVAKADVDMSGVKFEELKVAYDGKEHTLTIGGTLPDGVTVEYEVKNQSEKTFTEIGTYEFTAKFTVEDTENYNDIDDKTATLIISDASISGITATGYENEAFTTVNGLDDLKKVLTVTVNTTGGDNVTEDYELSCEGLRDGGKFKFGVQSITVKYTSDGEEFTTVVNITADREKVALPTFKGGLNYTGVTVKPTVNDFNGYDSALMTFVTDKLQSGLAVGSYKAVFALNDPENYDWATATTFKKTVFAAVVFDGETEVILNANEAAVDWNISKAVLTATKTEGGLPVFASESFIGAFADVVTLKYYKDEACTEEIAAADLAYETQYFVKAELLDTENFELDASAAQYAVKSFSYTTPAKELTGFEKVLAVVKANWLWIVIAVVALILLILIIALAVRSSKKKREREERRLAEEKAERERKEEERERREEERRQREDERRREEREERMAARMAQPQMMPQMPQMMGGPMPQTGGQPMVTGGSADSAQMTRIETELAAMKAAQTARELAEIKAGQAAMRDDIIELKRGGAQDIGGGLTAATLVEIVTAAMEKVLDSREKGAAQPAPATPEGNAAPATTQVPPDAVMTTVTTTKIDTTKKPVQNAQAAAPVRTVVRNVVAPMPVDDGRVFDVGGFYKPADPVTDMDFGDEEKKDI